MTHSRSHTCGSSPPLSLLLVVTLLALIPADAHAVGGTLCNMINAVMYNTGPLGGAGAGLAKAIATVGVLMVGVGAALGRVTWTLAVTVAVGTACMFAANTIAANLGGGC